MVLVAGVFALGNTLDGVVVGVRGVIGEAVKLPRRPVQAVAAALAGQVDHAASRAPVLRLEVIGHHAEFLNGILGNPERNGRVEDIGVLDAVEQDLRSRSTLAVDGEAHATICVVLSGTDKLGIAARLGAIAAAHVARNCDKVVGITSQAGKLRDLRGSDDL